MAAPTPWQAKRALPQPVPLPQSAPRLLLAGRLRAGWPYAVAAVVSVAVFFLLFKTWMVAPDRSGSNSVDAFGTTHTMTTHLNLWSQQQPPGVSVSGVWGILTTIAVFVTVFAAIQAIYRGTRILGLVTTAAAVAVALFVIIDLFYIRSKMFEAQASMKMSNDLAAQLGLALSALRGTSTYPWPGVPYALAAARLTSWAYVTTAFALTAAAVTATRTWYGGRHRGAATSQAGPAVSDSKSIEPADTRDWGAAG
ncbi:hypothetical protein [Nocardia alni]|uniref:hypothetical protein n=1 Tax=Nocardia alni TaxID=2815723 RepID=UPI001C2268E0|nr:hypothetical protein [Nocardia alni]